MFSSAAAYFTRSLKALVDMWYKLNRHVFFHNSINFKFFTPKFHLPANSSKYVIYDVMTYEVSQLGHDVQNWSLTVVHAVNVSTTRRRVELRRRCYRHFADATPLNSSCVAINAPLNTQYRIVFYDLQYCGVDQSAELCHMAKNDFWVTGVPNIGSYLHLCTKFHQNRIFKVAELCHLEF